MDIRYFGTTPRYSEAVGANGLIFLSGMVPENGETAAEQTADVLAQIDRWLARNAARTKRTFWMRSSICAIWATMRK